MSGGDPEAVVVRVDPSTLTLGDTITATLSFTGGRTGGNGRVDVEFTMMVGGLSECGTASSGGATQRPSGRAVPPPVGPYVPGELLIRYRDPGGEALRYHSVAETVRQRYALDVIREGNPYLPELVRVDDVEAAAARLERDPSVEYAHPNYYLQPLAAPDDPLYIEQWNLSQFGVEQAWDIETGANPEPVVVAVIDSGVDPLHEDLAGRVLPGCDFFDRDNVASPGAPNGGSSEHGTHVAGIAAASGNNGLGVSGVARGPGIRILPLKVFDDSGTRGTVAGLVEAILWSSGIQVPNARTNTIPADVINMSVGAGPEIIEAVDDAASQAVAAGVVLFASAGNGAAGASSPGVQSPANAPDVIAVGSVDADRLRSSFSDFGLPGSVDLMAPGGSGPFGPSNCSRILSTFPVDDYGCLQGTSMSSPFAAGAAALLLSQDPSLTPAQVKDRLVNTALFDGNTMTAEMYGSGILCLDRALGGATRCGD